MQQLKHFILKILKYITYITYFYSWVKWMWIIVQVYKNWIWIIHGMVNIFEQLYLFLNCT